MANKITVIRLDTDGKPVNGLITQDNGIRSWYRDGLPHREDGPAIEHDMGFYHAKMWFIMGEKIDCTTQEEFERILKLKVFL
jgi:hypothetical protein